MARDRASWNDRIRALYKHHRVPMIFQFVMWQESRDVNTSVPTVLSWSGFCNLTFRWTKVCSFLLLCTVQTQRNVNGKNTKTISGTITNLQSQTKKLGHEASSPLPPLSMLIIRWFFSLVVRKNAIFSNIEGGRGIRDTAQVSQLLLAGIVERMSERDINDKLNTWRQIPLCDLNGSTFICLLPKIAKMIKFERSFAFKNTWYEMGWKTQCSQARLYVLWLVQNMLSSKSIVVEVLCFLPMHGG